jgi:hypothetical protein
MGNALEQTLDRCERSDAGNEGCPMAALRPHAGLEDPYRSAESGQVCQSALMAGFGTLLPSGGDVLNGSSLAKIRQLIRTRS